MSVVDVKFTVSGTTYVIPVRSIKPAPAVADQPERMLIGAASAETGLGVYHTFCRDFSGPPGQEFWDLDSKRQGYRSGGLVAPFGYLQLPTGASLGDSDAATTSPLVMASAIGAGFPGSGADPDQRVVLPLGKTLIRSDAGDPTTWTEEYSGTANVTQVVSLIEVPISTSPYSRLYASFASSTNDGDYAMYYSDTAGDTWSTTSVNGEAIAYTTYYGGYMSLPYKCLWVAKRDGTLTRYEGKHDGTSHTVMQDPGRITFLSGGFSFDDGVFFLKNGRLYWDLSDDPTTADFDDLKTYPNLTGLACGTMLDGRMPVVCNGTPGGIWKIGWNGAEWMGLPANMATEYGKIVYLLAVEGDLVALATNPAGTNTVVLICPQAGPTPPSSPTPTPLETPLWERWQPIATIAKKPYAAFAHNVVGYPTYQKGHTLFIMCYDGSGSYVYHMLMPSGGAVVPGGDYASGTHNRVLPTFAPMPDLTGPFFGVEVAYDVDEVGSGDEAISVKYSTNGSDPTTEIGTINSVGRGVTSLDLSTPVAARVLDVKVEMTRGTTSTYTPRVFWLAPKWYKKRPLRESWLFEIDTLEWMRRTSNAYDDLMAIIATIHDATTPPSMTIGKISTTYSISIERVTPEWGEADTPDRVGPIELLVQEIP